MINESQLVEIRRKSKIISTTVIAVILAIVIFASTAFAGILNDYSVEIIDNGVKSTVTTNETQPSDILAAANITLSDKDKLDISKFEAGEGGQIIIDRQNSINIEVAGTITKYDVYADTVGDALNEIGFTLGENDEMSYQVTDKVENGMVINIQTAFTVSVDDNGAVTNYAVVNGTVADLLQSAQITLGTEDYTEPALDTTVESGMTVKVFRVTYADVTEKETIKHETTKTDDSSLEKGKTKVKVKGEDGEATVVYNVKYINGKEDSKTETARTVTKEAVTEVVKVGTKAKTKSTSSKKTSSKSTSSKNTPASDVKSNGVKSKNGYKVGQTISGKYTHYCACARCNGNSRGVTSSGKRIKNGMENPYYIACNWLPLGSVIDVDGTTYTVVDRGGSGLSRKGRIDIFTPDGHSACTKYGTGRCTITIVRLGW